MKIPPDYNITPEILSYISKVDSNLQYIKSLNIPLQISQKIQRISILKSSLFSARIEGNSLTLNQVDNSESAEKIEIFNIIEANKFLNSALAPGARLTKKFILNIHKIIMRDISPDAGHIRGGMSAIFNQAGIAVYVPPSPTRINQLLEELLKYIESNKENSSLIKAFIAHLIFEKIHPFLDGNGRVGRALVDTIFKINGYESGMCIPFAEYLDEHKSDYYYFLDVGMKQPNDYLLFMLEAFYIQTEKTKEMIHLQLQNLDTASLMPRQEEMLNIIKDHKTVSFDFIRRRFIKVPPRTLRYDLKKLADKKLILKLGRTRGALYRLPL